MQYHISHLNIVHDVIDGEVVIINLNNGNYYTMNESGVMIWQELTKPTSIDKIVQHLATHYPELPQTVGDDVSRFLAHVEQEGLVSKVEEGAASGPVIPMGMTQPKETYTPAELMVFSDMQELLLVDPVHEIDDRGWPHAKVDA